MRFLLYDVRDHSRRLLVDANAWRATLALLHQATVLSKAEANQLVWLLGGHGTSVSEATAKLISDYLTMYLLPQLQPGQTVSVNADEFEFEDVTDGTIELAFTATIIGGPPGHRGPIRLTKQWLTSLAQLCTASAGLGAISENARTSWSQQEPDSTVGSE
jgi:hypothetical protein